jgi:transcriptional regulator with XRE-family HTH domain
MKSNESILLKSYREASGLTQVEVSKKLGHKTSQFISNIENGRSLLPDKYIKRIAKLYGCKTEDIVHAKVRDYFRFLTEKVG